jgi:hypothetical protein
MKKIIALVLSLVMLLGCTAAMAEATAEKESLGVLKVVGAFDIKYSPLPDDYKIDVYLQNDMTLIANISTTKKELPKMGLIIAFNDEWSDTERLNDVSDEDMEAIKDSFFEEYDEVEFDIKETNAGTKLLIAKIPGGQDAYIYTIYKGHELEMHLIPGDEEGELNDADIERVVAFLSDMDFVPVETQVAD